MAWVCRCMGSIGVGDRRRRGSYFDVGDVSSMSLYNFDVDQKNDLGQNFDVGSAGGMRP